MSREKMDFDVVIVGAGPAGLSASIRLAQLSQQAGKSLQICVIDKAITIGGQILSGAVIEPRSLNELIPDWQSKQAPLHTPVTNDRFTVLTKNNAWPLPTPSPMRNHGNYIISLGLFCRWLAEQAESLGVHIFPGFAATEVIYENGAVRGIITGDKGVDKDGKPKATFQAGIELHAKQVLFAEGCRGSLTKKMAEQYQLYDGTNPQTYGLGIKELWEIPKDLHQPGFVSHSVGWPLDTNTYGGSFVYHFGENLLSIGFVVGLDYSNPYLNPYETFQQFKTHPSIYPLLASGKRVAYGAKTLVEGGWQSIPKLSFPGGLLIGDAAGFLNVPKIKGIHTAMKSGMIAAESIFPLLDRAEYGLECEQYRHELESSWLWEELYLVRNIRPAFRKGLWPGLLYAALDTYLFHGRAPWTLKHAIPDNASLKKASQSKQLVYPKHDNQVTFDLSTSLYLANIHYEENQPYHLKLKNRQTAININLREYAAPEERYCPAGVYEMAYNDKNEPRLFIHGGNCIHCKACDIKDPTQNITWTPSEGGSGPSYEMM